MEPSDSLPWTGRATPLESKRSKHILVRLRLHAKLANNGFVIKPPPVGRNSAAVLQQWKYLRPGQATCTLAAVTAVFQLREVATSAAAPITFCLEVWIFWVWKL